jgi:hypothetical protein
MSPEKWEEHVRSGIIPTTQRDRQRYAGMILMPPEEALEDQMAMASLENRKK